MGERSSFFVTCAPHTEVLLHAEMRALKLPRVEQQVGGVYFEGTLADARRANLWLRTAIRVLMRVARFQATDADALLAGARAVEWERFVRPEGSLAVQAHAKESALDHTLFIAQRVKDGVCDRLRADAGARPSVDKEDPDLLVHAHIYRNRCTLLVDTSGDSLHKRGWRRVQGRAPLAETLAASVLQLSGWDRRQPLVDPFCGSGTLLVEAALMASGAAPGAFRTSFGFERWPCFDDAPGWARERAVARAAVRLPPKLVLVGSDSSAEAVAGARENLEAAGLTGAVSLEEADARAFTPRRGWNACVVTNPPYGQRVGAGAERELAQLYTEFGAILAEHCGGYRVALLSGNPQLAACLPLAWSARRPLANGALACELLLADVPT